MRLSLKRLAITTLVAACLPLGLAATSASAATPHPVIMKIHAIPDSVGDESCGGGSLGSVCVIDDSTGYDAAYYNQTSSWQYVDFNLVTASGQHIGDQGAFWAAPNSGWYTYFFATGHVGCATAVLYDRQGALPPLPSGFVCP